MKTHTDFGQPAPDPFPNKAAEPYRLRLLALTDAKLTHGAARLYCLLLEWSYLLIKGGDGHGKVETTTRAISAAMGCNRNYVTKWQRSLKVRKYVLVDLVPCGRGLKRLCFRIVGMHQELSPEVGPVEVETTGTTTGANKGTTTGADKGTTTGADKGTTSGSTIRRRQENRRQETGTGTPSKTVKRDELLKEAAPSGSSVQPCEAPKWRKQTDTAGENEFLALIGRYCGELELVNSGGDWRNKFRGPDRDLWLRVWRDIDSMAREGRQPDRPVHYAKRLFEIFARK